MAITADYLVISDGLITLVPPGGDSDRNFTFIIPLGAKIATGQNPIITFMAWAEGGNVDLVVELNGQNIINPTRFNSDRRSFHEVVNLNIPRVGIPNDLIFRAAAGATTARIYVSDVVFWFQREALLPGD
ncbi:MAG: hypothetical protein VKK04_04980 [Synechococcales bacterium]|nr:hypothetical protein [Synechococcales bacterium]